MKRHPIRLPARPPVRLGEIALRLLAVVLAIFTLWAMLVLLFSIGD